MYVPNKKGCVVTQKLKSLVWTISRLMAEWTILEGSDFIFAYIMALLKEKKYRQQKLLLLVVQPETVEYIWNILFPHSINHSFLTNLFWELDLQILSDTKSDFWRSSKFFRPFTTSSLLMAPLIKIPWSLAVCQCLVFSYEVLYISDFL